MATEAVGVERYLSRDGQGKPSYQSIPDINARVVSEDRVVKRPDGTEVLTTFTVHVDAGQDYMPLHHDRLTVSHLGDQRTVIVESRSERKRLNGRLVHVLLLCREE